MSLMSDEVSMSASESNKQLIRNFFDGLNKRDFANAFGLIADDVQWWIIGSTKVSGDHDKRFISLGLKTILTRTFTGYQFTLGTLTAEEDRVSATAESDATHKNGKHYHNHFHFLFTIRDGKISNTREYYDTEHAVWVETAP